MLWIGLTGGIATGKSTVSIILRELGFPVIDADNLARKVTEPGSVGLQKTVALFGKDILLPSGELDRKKLGAIVFANAEKRLQLESILHPLIQDLKVAAKVTLENEGAKLAFYDVPLLFEKELQKGFDTTILVYASAADQALRLKERDNLSEEEIVLRLQSQMPIEEKKRLADYVIVNRGSLSELKQNIQTVITDLLERTNAK